MLGAERLEPRLALAAVQATFTADNHYGLYYGDADGTRLTLVGRNEAGPSGSPGTYNWSAPESFSFDAPSGSHLYVVAWDSGQWQMVAGQFSVAGGQTIGTSASAWQCLSAAGTNPGDTGGLPGTSALVAEIGAGSWQAPRGVAAQGTAPWGTIPGLSAAAQFIWPDTLAESSASDSHYVIFRTTYPIDSNPPPPVVVGTITADNHYGIYTGSSDGSSLSFIGRNETGTAGNPGSYNWSLPEAWNFAPAAGEHIYVVAWDDGGPQGWIGQFALPDGTTLVSNAQDWEAVVGAGPNPGPNGQVPSTDALRSRIQSATWQSIGAAAANGTSPWGTIPGIGSTANFIWHDKLADGSASDSGYAIYRTKKPVVAAVDVEVGPSAVDEDGSQGLVYTFTRSVATPAALTVSYAVGGTATAGSDYTGLPPGAGVKTITIPAGERTASVTVFPTADTEIEPDETVVLTLQRGTSYGLGTRTVATGAITNDDYIVDLVFDGLSEETVPGPNELSPGAILTVGGDRTRLDIIVQSPGNAGTIALTVLSGADKITLWDAEEGGQQVQPSVWQVGQHPSTLWVQDTGLEGDFELVAMFQNKGVNKPDATKGKVRTAEWSTAGAIANGNQDGKNQITLKVESLTYEVDVDLVTGDPVGNPPPGGLDDTALKGTAERLNKWMEAFAKQAGLGTDDKGRQFVGLFDPNKKLPMAASEFIAPSVTRPKDEDFQHIGNEVREGQMRNNIWRIEFVPVVAPWEWNATITLPEWKQFTTEKDRLNPDVEEQWKTFVDALAGHEKIHKEKWEQYVRAYQGRVDDFAKTRFFGEAADPNDGTAKKEAWISALAKFRTERTKLQADLNALADQYEKDQRLYDEISDHGRNQERYDPAGKNTKAVDNGLKLKR